MTYRDVLASDGRDLTADPGAAGDKTYGRSAETEALARTLASGKSAVLLGPPGVGKTAIVRKLLHYLKSGRLPSLKSTHIFEISTVGLCSDTRYTGMQEDKIQALLAHATAERWMYVPDLWNLPTAGSYDTHPRGIYDLMRPGIESGRLLVFGECTDGRWEKLCRSFPTLVRDFTTIPVAETSDEETREIIMRTAADLSALAGFEKGALDRVQSLARKFLPTQSFPGKAVELLRRVAHSAHPPSGPARTTPVDVSFVEEVFGKQSGLPLHMISRGVKVGYDEMHRFLTERVLGQKEAVTAVADVLALYKTGLKNPDRPAGVLLFVGPTGVGKTELAKATAEFLFGGASRMFRVDLSEYKDYHSFEKLIGDPKSGKPGLLTDHVRKQPFCVVLLDEFEKGHSNVADLFLQVFDDGRLTDAAGETVDFRHSILILTSNAGSDLSETSIGFGGAEGDARGLGAKIRRALEDSYRPEFLNRIDRILVFQPLAREDMRRIAQRELGKLYRREGLLERDLLLEVDDGVIDLLLERGIDPKYGARPLKRAIEETLVMPLARALLDSTERRFQLLRIARKGDGVSLTFEETESSRKLANLERKTRVDDGEGKTARLSVKEVAQKLDSISTRLAQLAARANVDSMRQELAALEARESRPSFWEEAFGQSGALVRRHRIAVEVQRFDDLTQRAQLVRELVEASFAEAEDAVAGEIVQTFVKLERRLARAERELVHFDDHDRGDAEVVVRAVGGKDGGAAWARALGEMYAAWAGERGFEVTRVEREAGPLVRVVGPYAFGYLKSENGGHRLIEPPHARDSERGETYLARVEVVPLGQNGAPSPPNGPPARGSDDEPPIRTYDLWRARGVKDRRTGWSEGDVKKVLSGRIDGFLDAALEGAGVLSR
jgi:ATP-dependent Clp protease ATP-binding subunit ClpC